MTWTAVSTAVGFRNLLVHQYADVEDRRAVAYLGELDDLRAFTAGVAAWLPGAGGTGSPQTGGM